MHSVYNSTDGEMDFRITISVSRRNLGSKVYRILLCMFIIQSQIQSKMK